MLFHHHFRHGKEKGIFPANPFGFVHFPALAQFSTDSGEKEKQAAEEPGHFLPVEEMTGTGRIHRNMPLIQGILETNGGVPFYRIKKESHLVVVGDAALLHEPFDEIAHPFFKAALIG